LWNLLNPRLEIIIARIRSRCRSIIRRPCQDGYRSLRAARFLEQVGFQRVVSVRGGTEAWRAAGKPLNVGDSDPDAPRVVETEWAHAGGHHPNG
jgi:hypothetical protein